MSTSTVTVTLGAPWSTGQATMLLAAGSGAGLYGYGFPLRGTIGSRSFLATSLDGDALEVAPSSGYPASYPAGTAATFAVAGAGITLTAIGSSGPATLVAGVLNIPVYAAGASPAFSAFGISGISATLEVGATISSGTYTFTWSTTDSSAIQADSIGIVDTTTSTTLATDLANTGSDAIAIGSVTNDAPASHAWTISGSIVGGGGFTRTFTAAWEWRAYYGGASTPELTATEARALAGSQLATAIAGTYAMATAGYKFVAVPTSFAPPNTFTDNATGLTVPMCTTANDADFSGTDGNGNNYLPLSITNSNGQTTDYAVYRTQNSLGGTLTLRIT